MSYGLEFPIKKSVYGCVAVLLKSRRLLGEAVIELGDVPMACLVRRVAPRAGRPSLEQQLFRHRLLAVCMRIGTPRGRWHAGVSVRQQVK